MKTCKTYKLKDISMELHSPSQLQAILEVILFNAELIHRSTSGKTPSMYKISSQIIEIVSDIFWNTLTNSALIPKIRGLVSRSLR